jgi:glycosyltransferase involved in cell wall biosynthesis
MISVVIPLYNKADYIIKCLQSVLDQTFREFELIIVDDGSTDNSLEVVNNFLSAKSADTKPHQHNLPLGGCKIIHQKNSGVSIARNCGVKVANYDYIAFLDADDWWDYKFLEEMNSLILNYPVAAIYGSRYYWVKNRKHSISKNHEPDNFRGYLDYFEAYTHKWWMPLTSISIVIRKNVFLNLGGFKEELRFGEDFDLWIRIALNYKIAYSNKALSFYNQDVDQKKRALGKEKHWQPHEHYIFNLDYLSKEEDNNSNLKKLLDGLRVRSLLKYYINEWNKPEVNRILSKVDFNDQPAYFRRIYRCPQNIVKAWFFIKSAGSYIKQNLIRLYRQKLLLLFSLY